MVEEWSDRGVPYLAFGNPGIDRARHALIRQSSLGGFA
jgi:hypothetical protein